MKTAIRKIFNKYCTQVNMDYNEYIVLKPDEFIKELAGLFASLNPERVREVLNDFKREFMMAQDADDMQVTFDKFINQLSDLCSGSQEKEQTKQIRLGEIFEVDGKKYAIQKPKTSSEETDPHGTITYYLTEI